MTTGNPLIAQGTLNRIRGALSVTNIPTLNVTASYLGKEGISLALDGEATTFIPTLTGQVQSGEPFMAVVITVHLLKTQGLAAQYKSQMESTTFLGDINITPDATTLPQYTITNCAIAGVSAMAMNGMEPDMTVTIKGYYVINNALWS